MGLADLQSLLLANWDRLLWLAVIVFVVGGFAGFVAWLIDRRMSGGAKGEQTKGEDQAAPGNEAASDNELKSRVEYEPNQIYKNVVQSVVAVLTSEGM